MSDWEEEMYDESEDDISFDEEYPDEAMDEEDDTSLETLYYQGKALKDDGNFEDAIGVFNSIIQHCDDPNDDSDQYIFKAIKQSIKILTKKGDFSPILELIDKLISQIPAIDQSYANASLYRFILRIDKHPNWFQREVYDKFDKLLMSNTNKNSNDLKRIRMKIDLSIVNVLINENELTRAMEILKRLEASIDNLSGALKGTYLLDIIVSQLTILINSKNQDIEEIRRLVNISNSHMTGIPHAKVLGVINEGMGLVSMYDRNYQLANDNFRTSFKGFNDAGDDRRIGVMTKYVISSLLSRSQVNPFDSNDFQGLSKFNSTVKLMEIYNCVQFNDIQGFNKCIEGNDFPKDQFLIDFLPNVVELNKFNFILKTIPLMKRVSFRYLYIQLGTSEDDLMNIIFKLYNRGHLNGFKIDFIGKFIGTDESSKPILNEVDPLDFIDRMFLIKDIGKDTKNLYLYVNKYINSVENGQHVDVNDIKMTVPLNRKTEPNLVQLSKRFNSLYIPSSTVFEILNYLGYQNTNKTSWNLITDPSHIVEFYIKLLKSGIPTRSEIEKSRIEKAELAMIDNDSKKIYSEDSIESMTDNQELTNRRFELDSTIPQLVQFSEMAGIEPPENPIPMKISIKDQLEIKAEKLLAIANTINNYAISSRLASPGIQLINGSGLNDGKRNKRSHHQFQQLDQIMDESRGSPRGPLQSPSLRHVHSLQLSETSSQTSDEENDDVDNDDE